MPNESSFLSEEDVFNLTCDKLRKELKKKRLSTAGRKSDLQFRLIESLQINKMKDQHETIHEEAEDEQMEEPEADEAMDTNEPQTPANQTFTLHEASPKVADSAHEGTPTNPVGLVLDEDMRKEMCANLGIDLQSFEVKSRTRVHRLSARKSLRTTIETPNDDNAEQETENKEDRGVTPTRQRPASRGRDRFAMIHAKQMEQEETLGERHERLQKRHEDLTANVPDAIKRLATPKSMKKREPLDRSASRNWKPVNPAQISFKFGNDDISDFSSLATSRQGSGPSSSVPNVAAKQTASTSRARAHVDVKKLTRIPVKNREPATPRRALPSRNIVPITTADDDTFTDFISTPKGVTPAKTPRRGGYTPHTKKRVFVDTTQLTDREYNLACEEGLIPGKTATKTNLERRQLESKKRRDDIIALKRKINIQ